MFEKVRAALYGVAIALNSVGLAFGWYSTEQGAALLGLVNAVLLALAFVNVPWVHKWFRPNEVDAP